MKVVVVGAGLGGLGAALRLQGAGHEVVVVEGRERPGGRAYQLRDAGFTWDTGPSLITMPWVLEETFAAGGLDLHGEVDAAPARSLLPDPLGGRGAHAWTSSAPSACPSRSPASPAATPRPSTASSPR